MAFSVVDPLLVQLTLAPFPPLGVIEIASGPACAGAAATAKDPHDKARQIEARPALEPTRRPNAANIDPPFKST
jgi:hypothetical protein